MINSLPSFKRAAEAAFRRANPEVVHPHIEWIRGERVRWSDGSLGYSGAFSVRADGFRPRRMLATWCGGQLMVR